MYNTTIKLLEETSEENLDDLGFSDEFSDVTQEKKKLSWISLILNLYALKKSIQIYHFNGK
jgi:hypothetical protein